MIWTLHDLDISDKHLLLLALDQSGLILNIGIRDENGELLEGASRVARGMEGRYTIDFPVGFKVENKGNLSITITLQEAGIFKSLPIVGLLNDFRKFTFYTVQLLENL